MVTSDDSVLDSWKAKDTGQSLLASEAEGKQYRTDGLREIPVTLWIHEVSH